MNECLSYAFHAMRFQTQSIKLNNEEKKTKTTIITTQKRIHITHRPQSYFMVNMQVYMSDIQQITFLKDEVKRKTKKVNGPQREGWL